MARRAWATEHVAPTMGRQPRGAERGAPGHTANARARPQRGTPVAGGKARPHIVAPDVVSCNGMTAISTHPSGDRDARDHRLVVPALPLALLESVRASDRPGEVLEDEDLTVSLPRRLGLTGVVDAQIRRYEAARQWTRSVPHSELISLYRLVLRRPDASRILFEAGRSLAGMRFERTPAAAATALRVLPRVAILGTVRRVCRRLLRSIGSDRRIDVRKPLIVRIDHAEIATLDGDGTACRVYTGLFEELTELYTGADATVEHTACMAKGAPACEWTLAPPPAKAS